MAGRKFFLWQGRGFTARLAIDVVDGIHAELARPGFSRSAEHGGVLLGRALGPNAVEITGFEFVRSEHRRGIAYDLGLRERQRLAAYVKRLRQKNGAQPVGYFHTHHRPGLFLVQDDFSVMSEVFRDTSSTALMISPGGKAGFFFWQDGEIDGTRTQMPFPFDASTLLAEGPIVTIPVEEPVRRRIPAWQAWAMAAAAALAGFGIVSASAHADSPQPAKVVRSASAGQR